MNKTRMSLLAVAAISTSCFAQFGVNLVSNPGADEGASSVDGTIGVSIPGWEVSNLLTVATYGAAGLHTEATPGSPDRGTQYFFGGPAASQTPTATQNIDLSQISTEIDQGRVEFLLSGWLGGVQGFDDTALVAVVFIDGAGESIGTGNIIGPTNAGRNGRTAMLYRQRIGNVPIGARAAIVALTMSRSTPGFCRGSADDLSLQLTLGPCPADWNGDDAVDGDDVIAFFGDWDIGAGDFNDDGGTDGDDVIGFFERWDISC